MGAKSTNIPRSLFHLGVAVAQKSVAHRDVRIDRLGFQLVVGFDGFREPVDKLCARKSDAGSIRYKRVVNDTKSVPVERVHGVVTAETDQITAIGGAKDRDDEVRPGTNTPDAESLPKVFRRDICETWYVVGNTDQTSDARSAVDDEFAGFLSRAGDFALENRINETHRIIQVIEEVGNPGADTYRHNRCV